MDNFEDNRVENVCKATIDQAVEIDTWLTRWSQFIQQSPLSKTGPTEARSEVIQQVLEAMLRGESCISVSAEATTVLNDLMIDEQQAQQQKAPFVYDQEQLYLYRYWALEQSLAEQVARLKLQNLTQVDLSAYADLLEDPYQKQALAMVAEQALAIITGGPGTGKTYTLARIIAVLKQSLPDIRIAMAAPTGKAAQRMKEALQNSFQDEKLQNLVTPDLRLLNPVTLHRLLGLGNTQQPRFHSRQPLPYDVIVVDEASMLDLNLAQMLFAAMPNQARLILLGDADQLASVDVGSVLADLQHVPALAENRVNLVNSRRFKSDARIGKLAQFIQQQSCFDLMMHPAEKQTVLHTFQQQVVHATTLKVVELDQVKVDCLQLEFLPEQALSAEQLQHYYDLLMLGFQGYIEALKQYQQNPNESLVSKVVQCFDDYRILAAIRHGHFGLKQLNLQIEQRLLEQSKQIKQGEWYLGRPVMMTYNDYQLGLSNGDIGLCLERIQQGKLRFEVYFPSLDKWVMATRLPKNIETAFALTIHKSQGSEFTHTAVVLDQQAEKLLSKELIYTAITRAKKVVSVLANSDAFVHSIVTRTTRQSGLSRKINQQIQL